MNNTQLANNVRVRFPLMHEWVALFAAITATHFFLIINDGVYWDGAVINYAITVGRLDYIEIMYRESSQPAHFIIHRLLALTPVPLAAHKAASFIAIMTIAGAVFYGAHRHSGLSSRESFFVGLLVGVFPAHFVYTTIILTPLIIFTAFLFLGWVIYLQWPHLLLPRAVAIALMILSFFHNSLLVFHFGLMIFAGWALTRGNESSSAHTQIIRITHLLRRHWTVVAVPIMFYALKLLVYPPTGPYDSYNQILLLSEVPDAGLRIYIAVKSFVKFTLMSLAMPVGSLFKLWPLLLVGILTVVGLVRLGYSLSRNDTSVRRLTMIAAFAMVFFIVASFPYIVVGKGPNYGTWTARQGILLPLPVSLGILCLGESVALFWQRRRREAEISILVMVAFTFAAANVDGYLSLQARTAKERALISALRAAGPEREGNVVFFKGLSTLTTELYRMHALNLLMQKAWGKSAWLGISVPEGPLPPLGQTLEDTRHFYASPYRGTYILSDFAPSGCMTMIAVSTGRGMESRTEIEIALTYLWHRVLGRRNDSEFLSPLIQVAVKEEQCPQGALKIS
jgi:hypothetical protein